MTIFQTKIAKLSKNEKSNLDNLISIFEKVGPPTSPFSSQINLNQN